MSTGIPFCISASYFFHDSKSGFTLGLRKTDDDGAGDHHADDCSHSKQENEELEIRVVPVPDDIHVTSCAEPHDDCHDGGGDDDDDYVDSGHQG